MEALPKTIKGGLATDERGKVTFCNDFNFQNVKRFYTIENASLDTIRAFHGHKQEEKYMLVSSGKALICAVRFPEKENQVHKFVLSAHEPTILHIPGGYANGIKVLEPNTKVVIFSTSSVEESKQDDFRFAPDHWGSSVWELS